MEFICYAISINVSLHHFSKLPAVFVDNVGYMCEFSFQ